MNKIESRIERLGGVKNGTPAPLGTRKKAKRSRQIDPAIEEGQPVAAEQQNAQVKLGPVPAKRKKNYQQGLRRGGVKTRGPRSKAQRIAPGTNRDYEIV